MSDQHRQTFNVASARADTIVFGNAATINPRSEPTRRQEPATIGVITALPEEFAAMSIYVDNPGRETVDGDRAHYLTGTVPSLDPRQPHRVVLSLLGGTGNDSAAEGCANLARSFASVDQVIMAGIAAGVPHPHRRERDVRLGDIVVGTWGIIDFDHVVETARGTELRQPFPRPSPTLTRAAEMLQALEHFGSRPWLDLISSGITREPAFAPPPSAGDQARVHYGFIGSSDRSVRNARLRDQLAAQHDLHALEMEGKGIGNAGFANGLEWLVVRGISDHADEVIDRAWRPYAALVAAAYVRSLLQECPTVTPRGGHTRASRRRHSGSQPGPDQP
jgi:nucleoside phosphorylase